MADATPCIDGIVDVTDAYPDRTAAQRAIRSHTPGTYLRAYTHVVYLPADFPRAALAVYECGMGAALQ